MSNWLKKAAVFSSLVVALAGCAKGADKPTESSSRMEASSSQATESKKLTVYASTDPIYDFTKRIGGDHIEVKDLMEGIVDAHHWEPTPQLLVEMNKADLLLLNGAGFESWYEKLKASLDEKKVVDLDEGIELLKGGHSHDHGDHEHASEAHKDHDHEHEHASEAHKDHDHEHVSEAHKDHDHEHEHASEAHKDHDHEHASEAHKDHDHEHGEGEHHHHGEHDPHYWLSIAASKKQAENIYKALAERDAAHEDAYKANFDKLIEDLDKLMAEYKEKLGKYKDKAIVVPHKAFSYFVKENGLKQISIEGLLADGEPNPQRMAEIVKEAKEAQIKGVLFDAYSEGKAPKAVAKELGVEVFPIHTLESVSDQDRQAGEDYISLMRKNLESIIKTFEGK